jgi:hypothetical protein
MFGSEQRGEDEILRRRRGTMQEHLPSLRVTLVAKRKVSNAVSQSQLLLPPMRAKKKRPRP